MKVIEVKPVLCGTTNEVGSLSFVTSHNDDFVGVSVFFKPENGERKYVKSFLLNEGEAKAYTEGYSTTSRDLGYILTAQNSYLEVISIEGNTKIEPIEDGSLFYADNIKRVMFDLDVPNDYWLMPTSPLVEEYKSNNKMCGLRLALVKAIRNSERSSSVISSIYPKDCEVELIDYK